VIAAVLIKYGMDLFSLTTRDLDQIRDAIPSLYPILYIFGACIAGVIVTTISVIMLRRRLELTEPVVEVSELRENWQESVHPNEIFINLDNLVMANRRYKEVPNRVYEELPPNPIEQVAGKGAFHGEMIQEVQPQYKAVEMGKVFDTTRFVSVVLGGFLYVVASILFVALAYAVVDFYVAAKAMGGLGALSLKQFSVLSQNDLSPVIHYILITGFVYAFARILLRAGHLFYAEMLFESNLIYMKIEGTFTESKISTGASIHDSTRSENTLVRSSITPWVVVSRLVTSTFASSGMRNLEFPRYILEMHKSDEELNSIKDDIMSFLKDRESIASITSERDLRNASQIYEINQQSRATSTADNEQQRLKEEAGGYIQRTEESES
ncbi:hypothetical protein OAP63_14975, partial [Vibrio sp.]|nr:hypothetical protein [Vibrio sp.]